MNIKVMLTNVYGDEAAPRAGVVEWRQRSLGSREDVHGDPEPSQGCKWCSLRLYQGILYCRNIIRLLGARGSVILFRPLRQALPSLHWYVRKSLPFGKLLWTFLYRRFIQIGRLVEKVQKNFTDARKWSVACTVPILLKLGTACWWYVRIFIITIINIKDWTLWSVPSPELQLLAPTLLRSSSCSPSLWSVVVWFHRDSVLWHSLQVWKPVRSVFIYLV